MHNKTHLSSRFYKLIIIRTIMYITYTLTSTNPSLREILRDRPSKVNTHRSIVPITAVHASTMPPAGMATGWITAVTPRINTILKIFDPIIFPSAIPCIPARAATIVETISGSDVPIATIVSPIIVSESPMYPAITTADSTTRTPPAISSISPPII